MRYLDTSLLVAALTAESDTAAAQQTWPRHRRSRS